MTGTMYLLLALGALITLAVVAVVLRQRSDHDSFGLGIDRHSQHNLNLGGGLGTNGPVAGGDGGSGGGSGTG